MTCVLHLGLVEDKGEGVVALHLELDVAVVWAPLLAVLGPVVVMPREIDKLVKGRVEIIDTGRRRDNT